MSNPYLVELERLEKRGWNISEPARGAAAYFGIPEVQREQILEALRARGWLPSKVNNDPMDLVVWVHDVVEKNVGA